MTTTTREQIEAARTLVTAFLRSDLIRRTLAASEANAIRTLLAATAPPSDQLVASILEVCEKHTHIAGYENVPDDGRASSTGLRGQSVGRTMAIADIRAAMASAPAPALPEISPDVLEARAKLRRLASASAFSREVAEAIEVALGDEPSPPTDEELAQEAEVSFAGSTTWARTSRAAYIAGARREGRK